MPLVARGSTAAPAPTTPAAAATGAVSTTPISFGPSGLSTGQNATTLLANAQAAHHGGMLDFLSSPVHELLNVLSQPAYAVGSAAQGHFGEALRHLVQVPVKAAEFAIPGSEHLLEKIPGIKPHENVFLSQVLKEHGLLPGGLLGSALGFGADVLSDPLTYATFGAGGALSAAEKAGHLGEIARTSKAFNAIVEKAGSGTHTFEDLQKAADAHVAAQDAMRAARGRGAHVNLGIGGTRFSKEVGNLPGARIVSKGTTAARASKIGAPLRTPGAQKLGEDLQNTFFAGGSVRKTPSYRAARLVENASARQRQVITRQAQKFNADFMKAVVEHNKPLAKDAKIGLDTAYEQLAHAIEKTGTVPERLQPFVGRARTMLDNWKGLEEKAGITYEAVPNYLTHMLSQADKDKFAADVRFTKKALANPSFAKAREVETIKQLHDLGYKPETNVARLLEARGHAHVNAMRDQAQVRGIVSEHGLRVPTPGRIDVAGPQAAADEAAQRVRDLSAQQPLAEARAAVQQAAGVRQGAQLSERVARRVPNLARQQRTQRVLGLTRGARDAAQADLRDINAQGGFLPTDVVDESRQTLAAARRDVEKARRRAVVAARSKDPVVRAQARRELSRAIRTHIDARIALADARGRTVGSAAEIRTATRRSIEANRALKAAEHAAPKRDALIARINAQPGREATHEEWRGLSDEWTKISKGFTRNVAVPKDQAAVISRIEHEMNRTMVRRQSAGQIGKFTDGLTSHWKALALISPGYHFRNLIGDSTSAWWAGARNPYSFLQAGRIIKAQDDPEKLARMRIKVGGETMTGRQFLDEADSHGISGQGFAALEVGNKSIGGKGIHLPGRGRVSTFSQKVGQMREDATRLGTYLDLRRQGMDSLSAAQRTHDFLYDYGHVSDFIESARRFWLPFITYTSKAVPRSVKMALTRPGYFTHHAELANALGTAAGAQLPLENLPIGQRDVMAIPDPGGLLHRLLSVPAGQPLTYNPERVSPWGSLNVLDPRHVQAEGISNLLNSLVLSPAEAATNYRTFYGGTAPKRAVASPLIQALHDIGVPIPGYGPKGVAATGQTVPGYSSNFDRILSMLPLFGQQARLSNVDDPQKFAQSLLSFTTGLPLSSYNRQQLLANAQKYGGGG